MNKDILEEIAKNLNTVDVINLSRSGKEFHDGVKEILKERRFRQFEHIILAKLKRLNDVRMFVNKSIAKGTQFYDNFMHPYLMDKVFDRFIEHVYPDWVEGSTFDREPETGKVMHLITQVDDFTLEVTFDGGFTGSYGREPWYNWLGIAITSISAYTEDDILMRWYKKYDEVTETQTYGYNSKGVLREHVVERDIKDVLVNFDTFRMTPDMSPYEIKKTEDDFEDEDDYYENIHDAIYNEAGEHCLTPYLQETNDIILKPNHHRFKYACIIKKSIEKVFLEIPDNIFERIMFAGDVAISMHLNRLQSWSPSYLPGFLHGRDIPAWHSTSIENFGSSVVERLRCILPEWEFKATNDKSVEFTTQHEMIPISLTVAWRHGTLFWFVRFSNSNGESIFSLDFSSRKRYYHIQLYDERIKPTKKLLKEKAFVESELTNAGFTKSRRSFNDDRYYFDSWEEYKEIFAWIGYEDDDEPEDAEYDDDDGWDSEDYDPEEWYSNSDDELVVV
ncbi:hypothetical protein PBCV1_A368L [Paramecium bursaria Chlorella virus 1]|uniref:Uncharacterized protein n=1 Tax=Paramecium bursaria Chlorella virus 1 TaxID=10506 RepID=Q98420_PBCV1|nr:hypothetical protein PBCV1_A368L [Paramecium bursaria Chlorella virus 1]AAC96736.2 hypothetical protein [Paramecium bursaria Chlorella virus 1]